MDKKEHIIIKAIELFAEFGFDNTSIRELSKKAGVNIAMINYYFGSKEKLFAAVIEYKSNYLKSRLEELRSNTGMDEMEKVRVIIEEYVGRILANPQFHRILHQELLLMSRPEVIASIKTLFNRNFETIRGILTDGMEKNIFRQVDLDLTISTLFGTINHFIQANHILDYTGVASDTKDNQAKRLTGYLQDLLQKHLSKNHSS